MRSLIVIAICFNLVSARIHHLELQNDERKYFKVSSFGYLQAGELVIDVPRFSFDPFDKDAQFGITLARTMSDSLTPYLEAHEERCLLLDDITQSNDQIGIVSMLFDFKQDIIRLSCSPALVKLRLTDEAELPKESKKTERRRRRAVLGNALSPKSEPNQGQPIEAGKLLSQLANSNNTQPLVHEAPIVNRLDSPANVAGPQVNVEPQKPSAGLPPDQRSQDEHQVQPDPVEAKFNLKPKQLQPIAPSPEKPVVKVPIDGEGHQPSAAAAKPQPAHANVNHNVEEPNSRINPEDDDSRGDDEDLHDSKENQDLQPAERPFVPAPNLDQLNKDSTCQIVKAFKLIKKDHNVYSFKFKMLIVEPSHEGLYSVFFHACPNYAHNFKTTKTNLSMIIIEKNLESYLSAGEAPLPELYFALSVLFFILGGVWVQVVKSKREESFKIHYLMGALVFVKAFALLFHGINFHYIATRGSEMETWAVLYYIMHFLKGALLFITIVLIGTGWTFVKHILSDKDKKIFMIVIPLQVLANIAEIFTDETEEGEMKHVMWRQVFILVDLLCCGAILFPVVWSIRHLQEASHIDGKAAINLKKLKIFRRFYIMIVVYIYFTRIIVYLLRISVPFQYEWLDVFCQHAAILVFFIMTGYHFQPAIQNPYFQLSQDDDLEMEEVLFEITPNAYTENLKKKKKPVRIEVDAEGDTQQLITKRESSHDFD